MGLRNAAQSLQKMMDSILNGMDQVYCYMDDLLVFTKTHKQHVKVVEELFKRLQDNGLAIHPDKSLYAQPNLDFLGFNISHNGISPLNKKVEAITNFPPPRTPKDLLGFLGGLNFYRRNLPNLHGQTVAEVLKPLYDIATVKVPGKKFVDLWRERKMDDHYNKAKQLLTQATNLVYPNPNNPLGLTCDASKGGVGAVLEEYQNGQWVPLGFWSRHLTPAQQQWSTFRRELYSIWQALHHFITEIDGRHCTIWTDHRPLIGAFEGNTMQHDPIAQNQIQEVGMWTNDIRFLPGKLNCMADLLYRPSDVKLGRAYKMEPEISEIGAGFNPQPVCEEAQICTLAAETFNVVDHAKLAHGQLNCKDVEAHRKGQHAAGLHMADFEFSPGITLFCDLSDGKKARPLVPKPWRQLIIRMMHALSHPGQSETLKRVADRYYWPEIKKDVSEFVRACKCQSIKVHKHTHLPPAHRPIPVKRFSQVMIDVVGPLPRTTTGMTYILTIIDRTSRFVQAVPMKEATAESCCQAFLEGWVALFGLCDQAITDNGNTFISKLWTKMHEQLGTLVSYTPVYHSASLGHLERQHRDIKDGLKACLLEMGDTHASKWHLALPWVMLGKRTAFQPHLDASPAEMVFGQTLTVPGDLAGSDLQPESDLPHLLEKVRRNAAKPPVQTHHHTAVPKDYRPPGLDTATHLWVKKPDAKISPLSPKYDGPFLVLERRSDSCVVVRAGTLANGEARTELHHLENCKPVFFLGEPYTVERPKLGRPRKDAAI